MLAFVVKSRMAIWQAIKVFCFVIAVCQAGFAAGAQPILENDSHFRMGIYFPSIKNLVSRADFEIALNYWLQETNQLLEVKITNAKLYDNIFEMRDAFDRGELDFVLAPPYLLAKYFDRAKLTDGFVGTSLDGQEHGTVLVVRHDRKIDGIADLTGKRLLLPEHDELAEVFLETLTMKTLKQHHLKVFASEHTKEKQSVIVLDVFFNKADAGVVENETFQVMAEMNPQISDTVKILAKFPTKSPNYGYFSAEYPKRLRDLISEIVTDKNQQPRSQQILYNLRMSKLVPCPLDELQAFDKLIREYDGLQKFR